MMNSSSHSHLEVVMDYNTGRFVLIPKEEAQKGQNVDRRVFCGFNEPVSGGFFIRKIAFVGNGGYFM